MVSIDEQKQALKEKFDFIKKINSNDKVQKCIISLEKDVNDVLEFLELELNKSPNMIDRFKY
jgi:hypothetical protein